MANDMHFAFKAEDIKTLLEKGAAYIVASSHLEEAEFERKKVTIMRVTGEGFDKNNNLVARVAGCPCPPCNPKLAQQLAQLSK